METKERLGVRGFFRIHIVNQDGTLAGDSGWRENQVTNEGFRNYLVRLLGALANSSQISYMALGTGTTPAAADTSLQGEVEKRTGVTAASSSSSKAVRFTATFTSGGNFVTKTEALSNVGLFASSTGGTIFAGNDYASSNCATNQNVNATYDITFT